MIEWKENQRRGVIVGLETKIGCFRLSIHRHIDYEPDVWLASAGVGLFSCRMLENRDLNLAKWEAVDALKGELEPAMAQINGSQKA